jgi:hypothetical protein
MAKNKTQIQYIVDHKGYGDTFTVTATSTGAVCEVSKQTVNAYLGSFNCFLSARADVLMRAVPQREIIPGTLDALNELSVRA